MDNSFLLLTLKRKVAKKDKKLSLLEKNNKFLKEPVNVSVQKQLGKEKIQKEDTEMNKILIIMLTIKKERFYKR